jgi:DNA-binding NarL/FixJ family response regulator
MAERNLNIVIVDDDEGMSEMLKDFLSKASEDVIITSYTTGEEALAKTTHTPTAVILDYHLDSENETAMDGIQVLGKFKERFKGLPVIFLTSDEHPEVAMNTMKYGAFDYVSKDVKSFQRLAIILNKIKIQAKMQQSIRFLRTLILILIFLYVIVLIKIFS